MKTKLLFPILFLHLSYCFVFAQGNSAKTFLSQEFPTPIAQDNSIRDSLVQWQERIVLHVDKKTVLPKDVLFFKAYVLTGPKQLRVSLSEVLKVELLNQEGQLITSQNHQLNRGTSNGSIQIPKGVRKGTYYLRAYTQWMRNYGVERFAIQEIQIGKVPKRIKDSKVDFYPEGGSLVAGLDNRLVMRMGAPIDSNVHIVNAQDNVVSHAKKYGDDTYSVRFTPKKGNQYYVRSSNGAKYALPLIADYGCTLQASTIDDNAIDLRIQRSPELLKEKLVIRGQSHGVTYWVTEADFRGGTDMSIQVPKAGLPEGLFLISVEDSRKHVWAERLLPINRNEIHVEVDPLLDKSTGKTSSFTVRVTSKDGKPMPMELTISIGAHEGEMNGRDMLSTSVKSLRKQQFVDDLLVLTNRFPEYLTPFTETDFPEEIQFDFQEGLEFYGQAYDLNGRLVTNNDLQVLITTQGDVMAREVRTDSNGMFKLTGLQLMGEATLVTRKIAEDAKSKLVRVRPYIQELPSLKENGRTRIERRTKAEQMKSSRPKALTKTPNALLQEEGTIILDGVTLVEDRDERISAPSTYGIEPTRKVVQDPKMPRTIPQLFLGIPGFNVTNLGGLNPSLVIPRSMSIGPILWVIDGFPLAQSSVKPIGPRTSPLREIMDLVSYVDIDRIEVLSGATAAVYGSRASGGVILIYTRTGNTQDYYSRKDGELTFSGYHESLDFDTYRTTLGNKKRNQSLSQTLYWNPKLRTDEKGEAIIDIDIPSGVGKIRFEATAIASDGKKGKFQYAF